jgi:hypothetical protein
MARLSQLMRSQYPYLLTTGYPTVIHIKHSFIDIAGSIDRHSFIDIAGSIERHSFIDIAGSIDRHSFIDIAGSIELIWVKCTTLQRHRS